MKEKTLSRILDSLAARHISPETDLTAEVQARLSGAPVAPRRWSVRPSRMTLALAACIILVTTVYALVTIRRTDPGMRTVAVTELNMTETVGDTTVTLEWAYADANRISVAYTMTHADGEAPDNLGYAVSMTDEHGTWLPWIRAFSAVKANPSTLNGDAHFDASGIAGEPETVSLNLHIGDEFDFQFTVPFIPAVRIGAQPPVDHAGITVNVEAIVITPSMTRITLCHDEPERPINRDWTPNTRLSFDGVRVGLGGGAAYIFGAPIPQDDKWTVLCREEIFLTSYETLPREITVTVASFQTMVTYSEENLRRAVAVYDSYGIEAEIVSAIGGMGTSQPLPGTTKPGMPKFEEVPEFHIHNAPDTMALTMRFPNPPDDLLFFERVSDEALDAMGELPYGERLAGPWVTTVAVPE